MHSTQSGSIIRSRLHVLHTGLTATHVVAVFGWLVGYAGDFWPNGERHGVGLNRGHRPYRKVPLGFRLAPSYLTSDDTEGSKVNIKIL